MTQASQIPAIPVVTSCVKDILEPSSSEQARAAYLEGQMQNMNSVRIPSSMPSLEDGMSIEAESLSRRIYDYCEKRRDNRKHEWETHKITLNSLKEKKEKQYQQQSQKKRDVVYARMLHNLERTRAVVRNSISRASTILAEECQLTLTKTDFLVIKRKMDRIDQKLDGLYQNWQAEYKEAVTSEECDEIRRFYKTHLEKYESKYRIWYQMLHQASKEQTRFLPSEVPTSEITPSLAVLDDAPALKQKEWKRGEPNEDIPQQYSTISGHLTPTPPRYEDIRMDSSLNVTPEGSLCDLPATVVGTEETAETPETHLKMATEGGPTQVESHRRIERTRETSRDDAIASTRHFFATVNGQNRTATELPTKTTTDVSGGNTPYMNIPAVSSTPIETETSEGENRSPRTFLPNGSPSRPTATATCRPQTWVQCVSEGQINEPTREGEDSAESNPSEPYELAEGIPDELGYEWRVLHPFEIPGVRFLTDNTPPYQRRVAKNDALVELFQTIEYLEDAPTWGQRDYIYFPPRYGDLFYRGRGRGRGRGRRDWLSERPFERETNDDLEGDSSM